MLQMGKVLIGLSIASAVAFANPTSELGGQSISKTDSEFLFNNNSANAVTLSNAEMKATEGESIGKHIKFIYRNTQVYGYNGTRIVQVSWKKQPVFRADYKANPSPTTLHYHFGDMKAHRPWNAPWRKYY